MVETHFSFVGYQPPTSVHTRAAQVFGQALTECLGSDAEFDLQNNVAESGLKAADCLSLVENGDRTFCYFASSYSAHRFPDIAILDLPFVVSDRFRAYQALDGDFGEAMKEIVRTNSDYELLGFWDNGFRHLSNRVGPIRSPADCVGLRIRTGDSKLHQDTFAALGFEPTFIDVADLAAAVASGEVDAQDNPLSNIFNFGLHHLKVALVLEIIEQDLPDLATAEQHNLLTHRITPYQVRLGRSHAPPDPTSRAG